MAQLLRGLAGSLGMIKEVEVGLHGMNAGNAGSFRGTVKNPFVARSDQPDVGSSLVFS